MWVHLESYNYKSGISQSISCKYSLYEFECFLLLCHVLGGKEHREQKQEITTVRCFVQFTRFVLEIILCCPVFDGQESPLKQKKDV